MHSISKKVPRLAHIFTVVPRKVNIVPVTENLPGIVGFGKAASMAQEHFRNHVEHLSTLRNHFIDRITNEVEDVFVNGSMEARHPGNASITFEYIEGESILLLLNQLGVYVG